MPAGAAPDRYDPIVPLIVAVALFMENMDSTVIATSLPAIAQALGTSPLALKLAVTSYLLALAIFIPASGWIADRFGARNVFRSAIVILCSARSAAHCRVRCRSSCWRVSCKAPGAR